MSFRIDQDDAAQTAEAIERGLERYNAKAMGFEIKAVPLVLAARDGENRLVGGIVARTYTDTLYIDVVWMDEAMRGKGRGRALVEATEAEARKRGARHAWLCTLSFQARPFYEKLGWHLFGEMPVMDGKHRRYFMKKEL